jgi:hypothetical protein
VTQSQQRQTRWTAVVLVVSIVVTITLYELGVHIDPLSLWVVGLGGPPLTVFCVLYYFTVPWKDEWITRALMVSSIGTAGLIDLALLRRLFPGFPLYDECVLTVLVFMSAGGILKLLALLRDKVPTWRARRRRRLADR